ncbi:MAG: metallophosphoesterase family protein [Candidatus Omnitrophota bacterium]|nr:metallophosphoesterase family protein [Candidatus Omnitrophota bacterium]
MKILVLSDTHIPRTTHDFPQEIYDAIEGADMILHAGDFVEKDVLDKLKSLRPTTAVYGNMDAASLHNVLNQKEVIEVDSLKIGLIHGYGAPADLIDTVKSQFKGMDAIVFGHSHAPINIMKDGILFFNPGSPTDKIFAKTNSYGILEVTGKKIEGKIITI